MLHSNDLWDVVWGYSHRLLFRSFSWLLTHWGRVTHICVSKFTIIGSDNGLSVNRWQTIIWNNAEILLIRPLGINFSEILIKNYTFSFNKMYLKMSSGQWRPICLDHNVLKNSTLLYECHIHLRQVSLRLACGIPVYTLRPRQNGRHFPRRHIQMDSLELRITNFDSNFIETCFLGASLTIFHHWFR